jgi:hypothetical protein
LATRSREDGKIQALSGSTGSFLTLTRIGVRACEFTGRPAR